MLNNIIEGNLKESEDEMKKSKKHYVTRWFWERTVYADAACGEYVCTLRNRKESTYSKNHVTCGNCWKTKIFRGIKVQ